MVEKRVLTDCDIKAMKPAPAGKRVLLWDGGCDNLAVRVTDKGTKSFVVIRRPKGERRLVNHVLGTYPALSLKDARKRAGAALETLKEGKRPREVEEARRREEARVRADTFEVVAEAFIKRHVAKLRSARMLAAIVRRELVA